jgi:hypothetical protein
MIAEIDLIATHPGRHFGRGTPRLLRLASSILLVALIAGVGVAALGASRAPSWTEDLEHRAGGTTTAAQVGADMTVTFADLFGLLLHIDGTRGIRLDSVDVRRSGTVTAVGSAPSQVVVAQVRIILDSDRVDMLELLRDELEARGLRRIELLDYTNQVEGVAVSLQFETRMSTERLPDPGPSALEPLAALGPIMDRAGAELLSVRSSSSAEGEAIVSLSGAGSPHALVEALGQIERQLSSPGRIASVTLRRQGETRASLDVRFSVRPPSSPGLA